MFFGGGNDGEASQPTTTPRKKIMTTRDDITIFLGGFRDSYKL